MFGLFEKKLTDEDKKKKLLLQVLEKLHQFRIGDPELLDDIQLDLEEGIPLSKRKIEFLKDSVTKLKENNKEEQVESLNQNLKENPTN